MQHIHISNAEAPEVYRSVTTITLILESSQGLVVPLSFKYVQEDEAQL